MIKLYNTPNRKLEELKTITPGETLVYTCGPTIYSKQHIGNYASCIYWDVLVRILGLNGYQVKRVLNLTDVGHLTSDADEGEDKMEKGARSEGTTAWQVAKKWGDDFVQNFRKLGLLEPYKLVKATDFIEADLDLIRTLKNKGYTYQISDGIYYDTSKFPRYADFARLNLGALQAGARVEHNREKRNITDFALWKFSPVGSKRDMEWETPADILEGDAPKMGFPGWHLECSTIIKQELGDTIDIHTGGIEHIPVHHTNEIAQSEAANDAPLSHYWLHNHLLTANGQKISKSLGNGYTLDDVNGRGFSHMDFKMWVLQGNFQSDRDFTFDSLAAAQSRLLRWRNVAALRWQTHDTLADDSDKDSGLYALPKLLVETVSDNLNTPQAMALLDTSLSKLDDTDPERINRGSLVDLFEAVDELLGLGILSSTSDISEDAKRLIIERNRAREAKDWAKADELRADIEQNHAVVLRDQSYSTIWEYAK
ncbi:MAG: cysteine--tRNA ligase [Candidatus Nomurabacteria bacterium]|jgi:cysteinyl-tRNA synthetase|nr:cysteine--tRNA ligase [Candidatus Nomurabacteria bacterium]